MGMQLKKMPVVGQIDLYIEHIRCVHRMTQIKHTGMRKIDFIGFVCKF